MSTTTREKKAEFAEMINKLSPEQRKELLKFMADLINQGARDRQMKCCFCGKPLDGIGNSPAPAMPFYANMPEMNGIDEILETLADPVCDGIRFAVLFDEKNGNVTLAESPSESDISSIIDGGLLYLGDLTGGKLITEGDIIDMYVYYKENTGDPLQMNRCCDECNKEVVLPVWMKRIQWNPS